ncbi:hypothetical protein K505DRAFT_325045 [Melanomma pulvis-pyrius CBS 109.77]|uniref:Uncharacterized protein n=1 Tax=Melanomma pulvis-pyrius CBS 109.77 TaxID=1314802 RepID=A0A6A6XC30_9PLEO|nr:hypothetical protein K505DRAFT_325045 [Melanomma pulvis-pyrius CBS 109.77]
MWQPHMRKIIFTCGLVLLPMLAFTLTIVGLVFSHSIKQGSDCAHEDLCPPSIPTNFTSGHNNLNYYVDFSATQLTFLASLSSTISFSLVSVLMALYAYSIASELLRMSQTQDQHGDLPTPYQTSMLVRVLNAELLSLWELGAVEGLRAVFKMRISTWRSDLKAPRLLRRTLVVFVSCLVASLLIQAADTYLHISTTAISMIRRSPETADTYLFSRAGSLVPQP